MLVLVNLTIKAKAAVITILFILTIAIIAATGIFLVILHAFVIVFHR